MIEQAQGTQVEGWTDTTKTWLQANWKWLAIGGAGLLALYWFLKKR